MSQNIEATEISHGRRGVFVRSDRGEFFRIGIREVHKLQDFALAEYRRMGVRLFEVVEWLD